jgi:hypothetical protein
MLKFYWIFILLVVLTTTACDSGRAMHEFNAPEFSEEFSFEGYAVDSGEMTWVYFLDGKSKGIEFSVDAPLLAPDDLFGCPITMRVKAQGGLIRYSLVEGAEELYSSKKAETCVRFYAQIFNEHLRARLNNTETY